MTNDLFGQLMDPNAGALSDRDRKRLLDKMKRKATVPRGHAWKPGTGPEGETCKTCEYYTVKRLGGTYRKCWLMKDRWTGGPGTDIRASDPACKKWEPAKPEAA